MSVKRKLKNIITYPIKSLGGVELVAAHLQERGLQYDRRYMLIDEYNRFVTIRQHPELLMFQVSISEGFRIYHQRTGASIQIPFMLAAGATLKAKIWDDEVEVLLASAEINDWFSKEMGQMVRLVYLPDHAARRVQPDWVPDEHHVSLADGYPYLVAGQASVDDLNARVADTITFHRFRPNLVVEGGEPYEEFYYDEIGIGGGTLKCIKPCTRCIVTTYHPQTGEKGKEPLKTLATQRINDNMVFGQNAILSQAAEVRVGDEVVIRSRKTNPYQR